MDGILQLRRGGTKRKAPSKSFREKKKAQFKQRKKDELEKIVSSKSDDNTSGIAGIKITGKNKAGKEVSDVIPANIPEKFHDFLIRNKGTQAAQSIIDNYASTAVNPYAAQIQRFKESPGGIEAFKERFPNPLVKAARGIGDFFREGSFLGKILSSLKPSDKKKAEIITEESRRVPYDPSQFGLGKVYDDKILRDQLGMSYQDSLREIAKRNTIDPYGEPDMLGITAPRLSGITDANKRQVVESFTGKSTAGMDKDVIDKAYNQIQKIFAERRAIASETADKRAMDDFTNFQSPSTEEEVVDEATGTENIFDLGSGMLSGSTSETDYMSEPTYSIPEVLDYNRPDQLRKQIDINTEDADLFTNNAFMGAPNFPAGGVESNFPDSDFLERRNLLSGAEQKNMGGYMGMSTFDKLKMIAQGMADDRSK